MADAYPGFRRETYPLREVIQDLKYLAEGYSLEQPEARAAHRSEGFARLETFCLTEAGEFTTAVLRNLCAVAARKSGKPLPDVLSLPIVAGVEFLERYATSDPDKWTPAAKQEQSEGNGKADSAPGKRRRRKPDSTATERRAARRERDKADKRLWEAWAGGCGEYKRYADLARAKKLTERDVATSIGRHRKKLERAGKWPPDKHRQ